jgi:hypothetical protein
MQADAIIHTTSLRPDITRIASDGICSRPLDPRPGGAIDPAARASAYRPLARALVL